MWNRASMIVRLTTARQQEATMVMGLDHTRQQRRIRLLTTAIRIRTTVTVMDTPTTVRHFPCSSDLDIGADTAADIAI